MVGKSPMASQTVGQDGSVRNSALVLELIFGGFVNG